MGDEKETWKVKTLDEILLEKRRRRELEERTDNKCKKKVKYLKLNIHLCSPKLISVTVTYIGVVDSLVSVQKPSLEYMKNEAENPFLGVLFISFAPLFCHSSRRALLHRRMSGKPNETLRRKVNYGIKEWK